MHPPKEHPPQRSAPPKLGIVLADDHALVREGLKRLIEDQDDLEVVGEAKNGTEAVRLVAELRPSILLVDLSMPDLSGVEVTRAVRAGTPGTRVIGVTRHRDALSVAAMFAAGAAGYVLKQSSSGELLRAIRTVAAGTDFIDATLPQPDQQPATIKTLNRRERDRRLMTWSMPSSPCMRAPTAITILRTGCPSAGRPFTRRGSAACRKPDFEPVLRSPRTFERSTTSIAPLKTTSL